PTGDPRDLGTALGPMSSRTAFERIGAQIGQAVEAGARVACGGRTWTEPRTGLPAWQPTVLTGVRPTMAVMGDETFGPVFPVFAYDDDDALWAAVEACRYGLNAAAFGPDTDVAAAVARLARRHRNVYANATPFDPEQRATRIVDGGYGASALHGAPSPQGYRWYNGPRRLARALADLTAQEPR
ncbi:MAG: putative aldehyde dehydrogenase AldA, partial [Pseudomonadota bacterium]